MTERAEAPPALPDGASIEGHLHRMRWNGPTVPPRERAQAPPAHKWNGPTVPPRERAQAPPNHKWNGPTVPPRERAQAPPNHKWNGPTVPPNKRRAHGASLHSRMVAPWEHLHNETEGPMAPPRERAHSTSSQERAHGTSLHTRIVTLWGTSLQGGACSTSLHSRIVTPSGHLHRMSSRPTHSGSSSTR
jgi:hypothetical protein